MSRSPSSPFHRPTFWPYISGETDATSIEDYLARYQIPGQPAAAERLYAGLISNGVPANRITLLVREARGVTADTALRLARYFGTTPELWLALQSTYDLRCAERETGAAIRKVIKPMRPAKAG